jgi:orotidine-5'-phosphate decarboxylase
VNLADKIIVALDFQEEEQLQALLAQLPDLAFVKVGMELFYTAGPDLVRRLKDRGLKVFLDVKVHDIPNTAFGAINTLSKLGCDILNVHCAGGFEMMRKAREALVGDTKLIGVTQLTSIDQQTMNKELLIFGTVEDCVLHYAELAKKAGLHGVVCSPNEVELIKSHLGKEFIAVTPGVRPLGSDVGDQKRVMSPAQAIQAGSDYLVVGRPITASPDPKRTFDQILAEIGVTV